MVRSFVAFLAVLGLAGCVSTTAPPVAPAATSTTAPISGPPVSRDRALANYRSAVARVEPVAERMCRAETRDRDCDFLIRIDPNAQAPLNAFQSLDRNGRPIITLTQALIADSRNVDELAFVIGHEAGHHIAGHLQEMQRNAGAGAILGGLIAAASGADPQTIDQFVQAGAFVGARQYSKENELEADALGTVIAHRSGFDPVRGAAFFGRIPDPGNQFLGSHPPNAERIAVVRRTAAGL